ncbi:type IV pilus modification PilV family protein [Desulfatibacillum aliphaticivorans]|uniref:type IV pilus modification PilV family protein n=1 Tax=Desulfatibacillum aliphaticivorans TaxID=218208 RepID=UPI0014724373|nr:prepilin-type N-terminal cleavage/methylation domain-containing protein [Desulfatibacillum aliphaticivorans]
MFHWTRNRAVNSPAGFTLLEMIISLLILGVALSTIFRLQSMSIMMAGNVQFETVAPMLAQKKMAEYMMTEPDELASDSGDFGDEYPNYSWSATVDEMESEYLDATGERLRAVTVSVMASEFTYSYDVKTYRFLDPQQ